MTLPASHDPDEPPEVRRDIRLFASCQAVPLSFCDAMSLDSAKFLSSRFLDTASRLTADCPGAVAVIELCTQDAGQYFRNFVPRSATTGTPSQPNRIVYGQWRAEDVVVVRTADHRWEIHCHGGRAAVSQILTDLQAAGATIIDAGSRLPDSVLSSGDQQPHAQVVAQIMDRTLQACRTLEAARWVLSQQDGRLERLRMALASPDEAAKSAAIATVRRWKKFAHHLTSPFRVALVGAPNAGKSSLMNALAGKQRAIVSEVPGTTRDVLEAEIVFNGWTLQIADTAGVRASASSLEEFGIQRAFATLTAVDLVCLVIDSVNPIVDSHLLTQLQSATVPVIIVWNKSDLSPSLAFDVSDASVHLASVRNSLAQLQTARELAVSALTGDGVDMLLTVATQLLVPESPPADTPLPLAGVWEDLLPE